MSGIFALVLGKALPWLLGAGGVAAAVLGAYLRGRSTAKRDAAAKADAAYRKTRERIDHAPVADSADHAREWLRDRAKK